LKKGIRILSDTQEARAPSRESLPEQPFDLQLLNCSPLYRRSRKLYLDQGGAFLPTLVSSPRTLSSSILLEQKIEYSPIERELIWLATDKIESKRPSQLLVLRTYCSSLYHEQNHRILWKLLPSAPKDKIALRRYLNFVESLVIILDMALGDELGECLASLFYLTGVIYDPGTSVRSELKNRREYRNYLQAALHSTYLILELFEPRDLPKVMQALFPNLGEIAKRAAIRSSNLDEAFIYRTNVLWQRRHRETIVQALCQKPASQRGLENALVAPTLQLSGDPMDNRQQYLIAEKLFDVFDL